MGDIAQWDERYRRGEHASPTPTAFAIAIADRLPAGRMLDLACGAGRHAILFAERGWRVVAVDGSAVAINILRERCPQTLQHPIEATVAELETAPFALQPESFDLILDCHYLNRALFPELASAVRPGGHLAFAIHTSPEPHPRKLLPGELRAAFSTWHVELERDNTDPNDPPARVTSELLLRKPA